jgi:ABC-type polysaccharide/polyol phosphate export permease
MASTPLRQSLVVQGRVIRALLLRELITRFGRRNLGVLWLVVEPMMFTLAVMGLWSAAGLAHRTLPVAAFAITGYSSVLMWRNSVNHNLTAIHDNANLLYHRNVLLQDVFAARILLEIAGATASFAVLAAMFHWVGAIASPVNVAKIIGGWLMLAWLGSSLAVLVGAGCAYSNVVKRVWAPMSYILFPLSGAAFMVEWLPPQTRSFVMWLPMVHGVEMVRDGYFGDIVATHYDMGYMATVNLLMLFAGLVLLRNTEHHLEAE